MAKRLAAGQVRADLILSSPARRALETARIIARKLDYKPKRIRVEDRLYPGQVDELLNMIHTLDERLECVMVVGHNPALEELAHHLSETITHLPTCAVAELAFKAKSWSTIGKATLADVKLGYPKKSM